jgi:glycosyl transferase, family 25
MAAMRCVVINLQDAASRWFAVSRAFERAGIDACRQEAVCGAELNATARAALCPAALNRRQYHRTLSPGEIGCYASHMSVWRQLLQSGESALAVFEDDIEVTGPLAHVLDSIDQLPQPGDIVKLIGRSVEKVADRVPLCRGCDLIAYRRVPSLTGGYVITRRGAEKLLRRHPPFGRPVDVDMRHWWECGLVVLGVQPYPLCEAESAQRTTIPNRYGRVGPLMRASKLRLQLQYSWLNWRASHGGQAANGGTELAALRPRLR